MRVALIPLLVGVVGLTILPSLRATPVQSSVDIPGMTISNVSNTGPIGGDKVHIPSREGSGRGAVGEAYLFGSTVGSLRNPLVLSSI